MQQADENNVINITNPHHGTDQPWTHSGFKRKTVAPSPAVPSPPQETANVQVLEQQEPHKNTREHSSDQPEKSIGKFCHYFANTGKCNYEERTKLKCKFDHKPAPQCRSGLSCNRDKCMFSHPRPNGKALPNFLGNARNSSMAPMMNPWIAGNLMNQWLQTANQFAPIWQTQSR